MTDPHVIGGVVEVRTGSFRVQPGSRVLQYGGMSYIPEDTHLDQHGGTSHAYGGSRVVLHGGKCFAGSPSAMRNDGALIEQHGGRCWSMCSRVVLNDGWCLALLQSEIEQHGGVCEAYDGSTVEPIQARPSSTAVRR